jgi:hypothetical protein
MLPGLLAHGIQILNSLQSLLTRHMGFEFVETVCPLFNSIVRRAFHGHEQGRGRFLQFLDVLVGQGTGDIVDLFSKGLQCHHFSPASSRTRWNSGSEIKKPASCLSRSIS